MKPRSAWAILLLLPGCAQQMGTQPSYRPLTASDFFADGRSSRPLIRGTVARGQLEIDSSLDAARDDDGNFVEEFPFPMTQSTLEHGRQRFDIFCSVCHGLTGHGDGRIVQRGFTRPPDLITDLSRYYKLRGKERKLTEVSVGHLYDVVARGFGAMPDYASQIPMRDRWAIVGYVKALQYSQSPALREKMKPILEKGAKP